MRNPKYANGGDVFTRWLVGLLTAVILGLGAWGLNDVSANRERIGVVETKTEYVKDRLDRIEQKLDLLLDKKRR